MHGSAEHAAAQHYAAADAGSDGDAHHVVMAAAGSEKMLGECAGPAVLNHNDPAAKRVLKIVSKRNVPSKEIAAVLHDATGRVRRARNAHADVLHKREGNVQFVKHGAQRRTDFIDKGTRVARAAG